MFLIFICQGGYFFTLVRLILFVSLSARLHKKVYFLETWMEDVSQPRIDQLLGQRLDTVHELVKSPIANECLTTKLEVKLGSIIQ